MLGCKKSRTEIILCDFVSMCIFVNPVLLRTSLQGKGFAMVCTGPGLYIFIDFKQEYAMVCTGPGLIIYLLTSSQGML